MSRTVVCDASAVVALLVDGGSDGRWSATALHGAALAAPALLPFEVTNILRRLETSGVIGADLASQSHADLMALTVEFWPHALLASRIWELRRNLTADDAAYVALAESIGATLVTLDRRISRAPGLRCEVSVPPTA